MSRFVQQNWMLVEYDDGREGLVPVMEGTKATLHLGADRAWGSTGCNLYSGPCDVSESEISIGPLAWTRMISSEGWMEQEAHFLALLEFVDEFVASADRLDLLGDSRSVLVMKPLSDGGGFPMLTPHPDGMSF